MERKSKSVSRRLIWALLGLLLIAPLVMLGYLAQGIWGGRRVEVARLKHKDHPIYQHRQREDGSVDYQQALNTIYSDGVTDDNNIVAVLRALGTKGEEFTATQDRLLDLNQLLDLEATVVKDEKPDLQLVDQVLSNGPLNNEQWLVIRRWLALQANALDVMGNELGQRDRYFVPADQYGYDCSDWFQLQSFGQWFLIRARVQASDGRNEEATRSLLAAIKTAKLGSQGYSALEQFNALYVFQKCSESLGPILTENEMSDQQLSELENELLGLRPLDSFRRYIDLGHRVHYSSRYDLLLGGDYDEFSREANWQAGGVPWIPAGWVSGVSLVDQKDDHCDWLLEKLDAADTVAALDEVAAWQVSENEIASYEGDWSRFFSSPRNETEQRVRSEFNFLFSGGTEFNILGLVYEAEVRRRILLLAIHLRRHYQSEGQLPKTLEELESEDAQLCLDPFSGRQLIYEPTESDRFKLYSVGPDRQDDGGATEADIALW